MVSSFAFAYNLGPICHFTLLVRVKGWSRAASAHQNTIFPPPSSSSYLGLTQFEQFPYKNAGGFVCDNCVLEGRVAARACLMSNTTATSQHTLAWWCRFCRDIQLQWLADLLLCTKATCGKQKEACHAEKWASPNLFARCTCCRCKQVCVDDWKIIHDF